MHSFTRNGAQALRTAGVNRVVERTEGEGLYGGATTLKHGLEKILCVYEAQRDVV